MNFFLETERLKLVPFEVDDLELLYQTFTDPFVKKYLWDDESITIEQAAEILQASQQHFEHNRWGLWKIMVKSDGAYAGFAGLWIFFDEKQPQLLYGLLPDKTGLGYATEASRAIIHYTFDKLKFNYLIASCDTPHTASRKVCERLNMRMVEEKEVNGKMTSFYRIDQ